MAEQKPDNKDKAILRGIIRHRFVYRVLRLVMRPFVVKQYDYRYEPFKAKESPFLLVSNHSTGADQFLQGISSKEFIRYVASEHIVRNGLGGWCIRFLENPIPKRKGARSEETTTLIKENLRLGVSVCLDVEGNRSHNGETGFISPRIGQLVKSSVGSLVTFKLEGGYLKSPRWAKNKRNGPVYGSVVREYTRTELDKMSADEIYEAVKRDLYVNEYERQRNDPVAYDGNDLAEWLETALYICPKCGRLGTLKSVGDDFFCECGYRVTMNRYGFFEGDKVVFDTVLDWDRWQKNELKSRIEKYKAMTDSPITVDVGQTLYIINGRKKKELLKNSEMRLYADRLEFYTQNEMLSFDFDKLCAMAVVDVMTLLFTHGDSYCEVRSDLPRSALKYVALWRLLTGKEYK